MLVSVNGVDSASERLYVSVDICESFAVVGRRRCSNHDTTPPSTWASHVRCSVVSPASPRRMGPACTTTRSAWWTSSSSQCMITSPRASRTAALRLAPMLARVASLTNRTVRHGGDAHDAACCRHGSCGTAAPRPSWTELRLAECTSTLAPEAFCSCAASSGAVPSSSNTTSIRSSGKVCRASCRTAIAAKACRLHVSTIADTVGATGAAAATAARLAAVLVGPGLLSLGSGVTAVLVAVLVQTAGRGRPKHSKS